MKNFRLSFIFLLLYQFGIAQCDIKTTEKPDGNLIKYFNPKPVVRQSDYEIGVSIYKNITTDVVMVNTSILFKGKAPQKLTGKLVIQTAGQKGISLEPLVSELIKMNGRDVAIGLYEIDKSSLLELLNYDLKSIFVYVGENLVGSTITENKGTLRLNLGCFK
ncbi:MULTISPECIES: hypothetical protein [unclassified Arenibacter]|uniref:hypothetical protein n=1 Tax=unclassified Arenibacter TaxID=2615047 RepID=UPI000E353B3C|nr:MULTISPECIES: hypothetical protein [unclassified Arenibacter]MCM4162149.1 hypothetical protein [Arenibacter sp. A80]RFT57763.1 hypothetical protein D0S24_00935 [Arenibacter sp. P308M17]